MRAELMKSTAGQNSSLSLSTAAAAAAGSGGGGVSVAAATVPTVNIALNVVDIGEVFAVVDPDAVDVALALVVVALLPSTASSCC